MKILFTICALMIALSALAVQKSAPDVAFDKFKLEGDLAPGRAAFTLTGVVSVRNAHGTSLTLLQGPVALTQINLDPKCHLRVEGDRLVVYFDRTGDFALNVKFDTALQQSNGWNEIRFGIVPSTLQPVSLRGLSSDTRFEFTDAARPRYLDGEFTTFLSGDGVVNLRWKQVQPEGEGKLFYAAEMISQVSVSPGLVQQSALFDFKVMQGELSRVTFLLHGNGEVTRVQGDQVLAWNLETLPNSEDRRLVVQFNQPQRDQFGLQIQTQSPLGAFPQTADVLQLRPEAATRFAGYLRVVNEGAVRLEVVLAQGLSQISPEQFPETDLTRSMLRPPGTQRFVYRFSSADFALRVQADQTLPELTVSELLSYHLGENELSIEAEFELDIREAPLRELTLHVPKGYGIAHLSCAGLSDYFLVEPENQPDAELRLVFGQPLSGRQVAQLRLERNKPLVETTWVLPRVEIPKAKSIRGHIATAADAGFRLTPERTSGLTEIASAFYPRKVSGIQSAFRLSEPGWQATVRVERLPQTVQADVLHLFSIGEGIAYGSSVMNYVISGAPVSVFKIELSDEYFNVEFTGKDIRNWQKVAGGYQVQLHTPVSGPYTLLAAYERPFKPQGETLTFTGARPLDAQSEQGHTLVISAYQFQVKPVDVSAGLLPLEAGEVPSEYRLLFDAPILAAYRYAARPFNLKLALSPLAQGDSLSLVVDRASLSTRISKEGQVLTDIRYFVKNRGNPHLRLALPPETRLWSVSINGSSVVPVADHDSNLIPLPQGGDPNAVLTVDLKLASVSKNPTRVAIAAPVLNAPIMLAEWKLSPEAGRKLVYRGGSLTPAGGERDNSGFFQVARLFAQPRAGRSIATLLATLALLFLCAVALRWASGAAARFDGRHVVGLLVGLCALAIAGALVNSFVQTAWGLPLHEAPDLTFLAPIQQAGSGLRLDVLNVENKTSLLGMAGAAWPILFSLPLWGFAWSTRRRSARNLAVLLAWLMVAWASLLLPNGAAFFALVFGAFVVLHLAAPILVHAWRVPLDKQELMVSRPDTGTASTAMAFIAGASLLLSGRAALAGSIGESHSREPEVADLVIHEIKVEDRFAYATAKIRWHGEKGQLLPLLFEPAVLTHIDYSANSLALEQASAAVVGSERSTNQNWLQQLIVKRTGTFDVELRYQLPVLKEDGRTGFFLPIRAGLVNRLNLTLVNMDVDVCSPEAVSVNRQMTGSNTVADLALSPSNRVWVEWKPRSRNVASEKPVFYVELSQLYSPTAGVIEGEHLVSVRLAQGELKELVLDVPAGVTITDVQEAGRPKSIPESAKPNPASIVSLWRFDPDARKLRITLGSSQARPFALLVKSQIAVGPLPLTHSLGFLTVLNAADQFGLVGLATGSEVQLDSVSAESLAPVNLEDFPADLITNLQSQIAGLTLRKAFRYTRPGLTLSLKASPIEPDIRVESQETLSLGEDRSVLADNATVNITRAGIFHLSFVLPLGFDVDSISGSALSHWTEVRSETNRVITLHLNGKTEGQQQFAISLAGPGVRSTNGWTAPQLVLREANKLTGSILLVPEQGLRLQVAASDGLTQLDPQKSGIKQKGVLAFRILQAAHSLVLNLEQIDAWVQVSSLQHATVSEAQLKVLANLQYQIENTGLKSLRVLIPTNSENVRFQGEQVADFLPSPSASTNGLQAWEVRLRRRIIGSYLLQVSFQTPVPQNSTELLLRGVQASEVNLQRGFVTIQSVGRLQVRIDSVPASLQPAEWQSIPHALQQGLQGDAANFSYRLVETGFDLPLHLDRFQAAQMLPGRINSITFNSVISDDGVMLTQARIEMIPGEKRLLRLTLPQNARFWFAFVNQNGVWPWREQDQILIPLEQQSKGDKPLPVEFFYSCKIGEAGQRSLNLQLLAPKFDLPLENITWRMSLSDKWELKKWSGSLQLQADEINSQAAVLDVEKYLQDENVQQQQRTRKAEDFLVAANAALAQGEPQEARRAFQSAYGLSTHDAAFNEDARVQLHNIKLQEALVGLNVRQAVSAGETGALGGKLRELRDSKSANYTQQDAKDILERNSSDENAAFMKLAERLIQQQDAAAGAPAALHASIPQQGRVLTFKRAVLVDPWSALTVDLKTSAATAVTGLLRVLVLLGTFLVLGALLWIAGLRQNHRPSAQ